MDAAKTGGLFALAAAVLVGLLGWQGYVYIRDNTKLLPQRETVVSYRESTPTEELAADVAGGGSDIYFFDVTYADGVTAVSVQAELWTEAGLEKTWDLAWMSYGRANVPYLGAGFGSVVLEKPTVVAPEHGVVLMCYTLDPTQTGRWRAGHWLGDVEAPTVEEDQAFLLVRLLCEYE